ICKTCNHRFDKQEDLNELEKEHNNIPYDIYVSIYYVLFLFRIYLTSLRKDIFYFYEPTVYSYITPFIAGLLVSFFWGWLGKKIFTKNKKLAFGLGFLLGPIGYIIILIKLFLFDKFIFKKV
ncbi:MAG: hypothetical protein QXE31_04740, partial [Candidatus Woesearchaeota archaeon]